MKLAAIAKRLTARMQKLGYRTKGRRLPETADDLRRVKAARMKRARRMRRNRALVESRGAWMGLTFADRRELRQVTADGTEMLRRSFAYTPSARVFAQWFNAL